MVIFYVYDHDTFETGIIFSLSRLVFIAMNYGGTYDLRKGLT